MKIPFFRTKIGTNGKLYSFDTGNAIEETKNLLLLEDCISQARDFKMSQVYRGYSIELKRLTSRLTSDIYQKEIMQ